MSAWTRKIPVENIDEALSEALSVARLFCLDGRVNLGMAIAKLMNRIAGKVHALSTALVCDHDCLRLGDGQFARVRQALVQEHSGIPIRERCRTWSD